MFITDCYNKNMEPKTPFGAALRHYRRGIKNLTQPRLSKELGISQAMLSKLELGKVDGSAELRESITEYFNIPYSNFIETGRLKLQPPEPDEERIRQIFREEREKQPAEAPPANNILDYRNPIKVKHYQKINEFPDAMEALELNSLAVELSQVDPGGIKEVIGFIKFRLLDKKKEKQNLGE